MSWLAVLALCGAAYALKALGAIAAARAPARSESSGRLEVLVVPVIAWLLARTPFGLRIRAVGEHPEAASSLGVPVARVRWIAVLLSGALAAMGGVYLALDQHQFTDQMTAGRGFIALAAVIFGRWDPLRAGLPCLLFATAETAQIRLQGTGLVPSQFVEMIPYVLTIVALAGVVGRAVPPAAGRRPAGLRQASWGGWTAGC